MHKESRAPNRLSPAETRAEQSPEGMNRAAVEEFPVAKMQSWSSAGGFFVSPGGFLVVSWLSSSSSRSSWPAVLVVGGVLMT